MNIASMIPKVTGSALLAGALLFSSGSIFAPQAEAQFSLSVNLAPPAIPLYEQPLCPGDGYIWTPGYWAWTDEGYEWVDGAWVLAPYQGALWTPGYWAYGGNGYLWNAGYWGRNVGYYGGINYGFGYFGTGFYGGYWGGGRFFYNRAYNRIDERRVHEVYDRREHGFDGRPGGEGFARHDDHGGIDRNRGSFAGNHDDQRGRDDRQPNRDSGVDQRRDGHNDSRNNDQRGFAGNTNQRRETVQAAPAPSRAPFTPNNNLRQSTNTAGFPAPPDRQGLNNQPTQGRPPFNGNQPARPVYNGGGQSFPGGSFNRTAPPQQQQPMPQRQGFTPAPQNNAPRNINPSPAAPQQAPRQFSGGAPQGGGGFHGGDNHGSHR